MPRFGPAALVAASLTLALSACGTPGLIGSAGDIETTGSIGAPLSLVSALGEADATQARAALDKALDPRAAGNPAPWSNKESGRSGDFAAVGQAYLQDDRLCRAFIASIVEEGSRRWLRGAACREGAGPWAVSGLRSFDGNA